MVYELIYIAIFVWVVFLVGAERIENSVVGYFEFGLAGEKAIYIKYVAWLGLIMGFVFYVFS